MKQKTGDARKNATYLFNPLSFFIQNTSFMSDLLRERPGGRPPSVTFNPFLFFFALLLAGVPLSYFFELISNPFARDTGYWADVSADARIPFAAIKSARQSGGLWREFDAGNPGTAFVSRIPLRCDTLRAHRPSRVVFRERP